MLAGQRRSEIGIALLHLVEIPSKPEGFSFSLSCSISRRQWKESELQLFPGPSAFGAIEFRWSQVHPDSIAGDPTYDNGSFYSCSRPWRYALRARPREHS